MNFAVFDIECKNWNEFLGLGFYNGKDYRFFDTIVGFVDYVLSLSDVVIFAHNGGRYDFLFLFDYILNEKRRQEYKLHRILHINSSIVSFRLGDVEFRDSLNILPGSLGKIAPFFGESKLEIDYDNIENEDWQPYLKQDCVGLYNILRLYFEYLESNFNSTPGITIASTAMRIYRSHFDDLKQWKSYYDEDFRDGYLGGRCEIFKMKGSNLNGYDINSMYPYVMHKYKYPVGKPHKITKGGFSRVIESDLLGICKAKVHVPITYIPLLPVRDKKMLFLTGTISGVWTLSEFREALSRGVKPISFDYCIYYRQSKRIFQRWVDRVYTQREFSKNEGERFLLKCLQTNLYGKFGQKPEKEQVLFDHEVDSIKDLEPLSIERGIWLRNIVVPSKFIIPSIAAHVTSFARIELAKYLDDKSYYCDTDSVFTTRKLPTSKKLGAMKLEYPERISGEFFYPKIYRLKTNQGEKIKAKGFQFKSFSDKNKEQRNKEILFRRIISKESISIERILSFKQCLRRGVSFTTKEVLTKRIRKAYDKRRVLPTGNTEPWTLQSYKTELEKRKKKERK